MSNQLKIYQTRLPKRKQAEENEQQAKRQKTVLINQTQLCDVNIDCLEHIFNHLSFDDLLNFADTSKDLKPAADLSFTHKFGKKRFNMISISQSIQDSHFDGCVEISCLKTALKTLRSFGHLISKLYVESIGPWSSEIINYTNQYCSKSLTEIEFYGLGTNDDYSNDLFRNFMTFINVEKVCFNYCSLNEQFSTFFPKMCSLTLLNVQEYRICIATHFPHLQRLEITGLRPKIVTIRSLIRRNPQLRDLVLPYHATTHLIRFISENLQLLENLDVHLNHEVSHANYGDLITFERLKRLKINYHYFESVPVRIPISSEELEEFSYGFSFCSGSSAFNNIINFLKDHPFIMKLNIKNTRPNSFVTVAWEEENKAIAEALPLLQEINFGSANQQIRLSIKSVIPFTEYESVKTIRFSIDTAIFDELKARLGNEWQTTVDNNNQVELKRND